MDTSKTIQASTPYRRMEPKKSHQYPNNDYLS